MLSNNRYTHIDKKTNRQTDYTTHAEGYKASVPRSQVLVIECLP